MRDLQQQLQRYRWRIAGLLIVVGVATLVLLALLMPGPNRVGKARAGPVSVKMAGGTVHASRGLDKRVAVAAQPAKEHADSPQPPAVGVQVFRFVDNTRRRTLITIVRYPAVGATGAAPLENAKPQGGPYPLIVFGHGFAVTPAPYEPLLDAWVRAGYVVAAPIFPKGNANAPGGPDEHDLPNQPTDMNFVIDKMLKLSASSTGPLAARIAPRVAVAGQSDGGDTALATAFDPAAHHMPIEAAVILSGAEDPFAPAFQPQAGTPLLAIQGTADNINPPEATLSFFRAASPPKYLLLLDGAGHQEPYTVPGARLSDVARLSVAFLNRYLKLDGAALHHYIQQGNAGGGTELQATP
jgi:fermentation-respiration switch protein FrsA (DUF1100 family)